MLLPVRKIAQKLADVGVRFWFKTHNAEFEGLRVPFGCKAIYMPSDTKSRSEKGDWDAPTSVGVFAGYRMKPGDTWHGEYLVLDLAEFADLDFSLDGARLGRTFSETHVSKRLSLYEDVISFPLKVEDKRVNHKLAGINAQTSRKAGGIDAAGGPFCLSR